MDIVIIILGILYLFGAHVGKGLAICAIIEGVWILFLGILKVIEKYGR